MSKLREDNKKIEKVLNIILDFWFERRCLLENSIPLFGDYEERNAYCIRKLYWVNNVIRKDTVLKARSYLYNILFKKLKRRNNFYLFTEIRPQGLLRDCLIHTGMFESYIINYFPRNVVMRVRGRNLNIYLTVGDGGGEFRFY